MKPRRLINSTSNKYVEELTAKVLNCTKRDCFTTSTDFVVIEDYDLDRIYLDIDGYEYVIRTWDIEDKKKIIYIRWSLYYYNNQENKSETLNSGVTYLSIKEEK